MDEQNKQEDDYVEEEIEVYEEVEVDEQEEKNDTQPSKQKSIKKIETIKNPIESQTNNDLNIKKNENSNDNKLPLLDDKIKYEFQDNYKDFNQDMIKNFNINNNVEENKYLNLDYKINPEKDNLEQQNNLKKLDDYKSNEITTFIK